MLSFTFSFPVPLNFALISVAFKTCWIFSLQERNVWVLQSVRLLVFIFPYMSVLASPQQASRRCDTLAIGPNSVVGIAIDHDNYVAFRT